MSLGDIGYGYRPRASYACDPARTRGRLIPEPESPTRTPFQRDRDRIIHSNAFRRLKHKTQVFVAHEGDHFRTRLTHTIEVSQIARAIARSLMVDEDLAEAVALVHDFGHTPFGHTGEDALDEKMAGYGGFDHNAQSLRIVTRLERRYAAFDGLNLTWESLEGLVKHNGPLTDAEGNGIKGPVPHDILDFDADFPLGLAQHASLEAQAAAIADDIAYNTHDIDDGTRAGLFTLEDLEAEVPFVATTLETVRKAWPGLDRVRTGHEFMRRQITAMVEDVIVTAQERLQQVSPAGPDDVRNAGMTIAGFSDAMRETDRQLKRFLFARMYRHPDVVRWRRDADRVVRELFDAYMADPAAMTGHWAAETPADETGRARHVADFLSGMTDTYALKEYERLFDRKVEMG
ncbi:deoxyguanosinetriphosphate triphosphohydrolase [Zhengella mangrovi]|uniref:Deoxyguanosinetriphosphate triphosphohydrolase-like protein n=1 Tax=Zhengella mangrovi TaxID=1982044 RepID=A0A2G1QR39_9HYPH|nr:deoxyguanosinetriphosphate triphosphohydrolase [Zhengella mangrovi]PHP67983.1 deoxyguanosinetriphosphate triphosphohydrolase [Zhengella mangrovi]